MKPITSKTDQNSIPLIWAFILPALYWIYLFFSTTMDIKFDAAGYQQYGETIYRHGYLEYLKIAPEKVPLYSIIISFSMWIADHLHVSYQTIQKIIQIGFLSSAQFFTMKILQSLKLHQTIIFALTLYFGFSPALVNSAFSLFPEIPTYVFTLGILWACIQSWELIQSKDIPKLLLWAFIFSALFVPLTLLRPVFEYVLIVLLFCFFCLALPLLFQKRFRSFINTIIFITIAFCVFQASVYPLRMLNFKHNGYKSLTVVGNQSLYATALGRVRPLNTTNVLTFLSFVPGQNICERIFKPEECGFWSKENNISGKNKTLELRALGMSNSEIDNELKNLAITTVLSRPIQYSLLTFAEGFKLIFWESTEVGFVNYPQWLTNIFVNPIAKFGTRLMISLITFISLIMMIKLLWQERKAIYQLSDIDHKKISVILFSLILIVITIALYAPFRTAIRYAFSIVPLYFILIGLALQKIFNKPGNQ